MDIVALSLQHQAAIGEYVAEFTDAGEKVIHGYFGKPDWSHVKTVETLAAWERGEELGGWVPSSTRFLVHEGKILGNFNVRHRLTDALLLLGGHCGYSVRPSERKKGYATLMLSHAKEHARAMDIDRMLLTCQRENIGSAKTIENNGGILQDVVRHEEQDVDIARYWITL